MTADLHRPAMWRARTVAICVGLAAASAAMPSAMAASHPSSARSTTKSGHIGPYQFSDGAAKGTGISCGFTQGDLTRVVAAPPSVKPWAHWRAQWKGQYVRWTVTLQRRAHGRWVVSDTRSSDPTYAPFGRWTTFDAVPAFTGSRAFPRGDGAYRVLEQLQWIRPTANAIPNPPIDGTVSSIIRHYHYAYSTSSRRHACQNRAPTIGELPVWEVTAGAQSIKALPIADADGDRPLRVHVRSVTEGSKKLVGFATVHGHHLDVNPSTDEVGMVAVRYDVTDPAGAVSTPSILHVNVVAPGSGASRIAVSSSVNPAVAGQTVTFTATVAASPPKAPGVGAPGGTVEFQAGGSDLPGCGAVAINAGAARCVVDHGFPASSQVITALYSGDTNFNGAQASLTQTINIDATTVAVTASANSLVTGQPATFTATVTPVAPGGGTPTGKVDFTSDGTDLPGCSAVVVTSGVASCSVTSGFLAGVHHLVAFYSGDSSFAAADTSTSPLAEQVNPAATATTLAADSNPAVTGQSVTFTASVAVSSPGTTSSGGPGGTVEFQAGGSDITGCGAVAIVASSAQCVVTGGFLASSQTITALYTGDNNFSGSQASLTETVNPDATTVAVTASDNPTTLTTTFTATVTPDSPGSGVPTGTVIFTVTDSLGGTYTCKSGSNTAQLMSGTASCEIDDSTLASASGYTVGASYSGDANFLSSSGSYP